MCGGKSTTQQTTTIPPEILARYNAVNARAEDVAKQPFQPYTGEFVAPINQQQMAGIGNINAAANMAQPYFGQAASALSSAYGQATPYYDQSLASIGQGIGQATNLYNQSLSGIGGAQGQANNLYGSALGNIANATNVGARYGIDATQFFNQAGNVANPLMNQSGQYVTSGLGAAAPLLAQSQQFLQGSTQNINPEEFGSGQIQKYMSPYLSKVIDAQTKLAEQQNAIQRSALNTQAIGSGAFGGDRAGIAQANLAGQQSLAQQATMGNLLQSGYGQALGAFQQQQGVNLAAQQANRAAQQFGQQAAANLAQQQFGQNLAASQQMGNLGQALFGQRLAQGQAMAGLGQQLYGQNLGAAQAQAGIAQNQFGMGAQQAAMQQAAAQGQFGMSAQQAALQQQAAQGLFGMGAQYASGLAGIGTGAQAAALQGAQAQIGAGTLQQQTQQAQDTAQYQQFLQERGFPYQQAQFLANIAMGTGALSGSTTTTTQPNSFFSDRRLKKDIKEIGETHDGLPIYSFKYKNGDDQQRIGVMADEAREKHPDAVHRVGGIDTVDYEKIANRASEGGGVMPSRAGEGFAEGGHVSPEDLASIIAMQKQFLGPHGEAGLYGQSSQNLPGQKGIVPQASLPVARLQRHSPPPQQQSGMRQAMSELGQANQLGETLLGDKGLGAKARQAYNYVTGKPETSSSGANSRALQQNVPASSTSVPQPIDIKAALKTEQKVGDLSPAIGGVVPSASPENTKVVDLELGKDYYPVSDFDPVYSARGGVIPHKAVGGGSGFLREGVLPYQTEEKYGPEAVNEAESGEKYDLLKPDSPPPKQKSGFENVLDAAKLATKVVGMFMVKDGGAIKGNKYEYGGGVRPAFEDGGEAKKEFTIDDYLGAIANIESRGYKDPYSALGPVTQSGDRAYGKYQVMGKNIPEWSERHLGQRMNPQEFLQNREAQEAIARGQFSGYLNKYGTPEDAASAWFSGRPMARAGNSADVLGTTVPEYINKFRAGLGLSPIGGGGEQPRRSVAPAESTVDEAGRRTDTVEGKPVSGGLATPVDYRTGKPYEGWGDFLTSRQFIVPVLSGLGAMAASPSRYWGGAALQGLGAAAQSYAAMEKPITEGEERRGLAATAAETAKKVAEETKAVTGNLYEKKWIAGMGWFVYDKTKPYEPPMQITDKDLRPIGSKKVDIDKIPTAKDSGAPPMPEKGAGAGAGPTTTAPSEVPSKPTTSPTAIMPSGTPTGQKALQALSWKATTEMPQGYVPPNQFNIEMDEDSKRREQSIAGPMIREQRSRANAANKELYRLDEMTGAFNTLPPNGLLTSGKYASERLNFVKTLNTFSQIAGGKPLWDTTQVGAAEQLAKDAFRLGQSAANSAGTVAGRDIIEQSIMATPGMELTAAGFRRVAAGMRAAAQYEIDKANFLDNYSGQWGHLSGAEELFNKLNPPEEYARKAVLSTIDPALLKRVNAYVEQYKDRPIADIVKELSPSIDRLYGTGVTAKILGAK